MKLLPGALPVGCLVVLCSATALAVAPPDHLDHVETLEVARGERARPEPTISWDVPGSRAAAWARFTAAHGPKWRASWDAGTQVPSRVYGAGLPAPGATTDAKLAEDAVRALLGAHLELFAPGAALGDLELVSNDLDAASGLRTVGFVQRHRGLEVRGGQVNARIKKDRIIVLGSEALPDIDVTLPAKLVDGRAAQEQAKAWIAEHASLVSVRPEVSAPFILPIVTRSGAVQQHVVVEVVVDAQDPLGRWSVFLDAGTGERVARRQTLLFAAGTVRMNAPERHPGDVRIDYAAPEATFITSGQTRFTTADGLVQWDGEDGFEVLLQAKGREVNVDNAAGSAASATFFLDDGVEAVWDMRDEEYVDAQIATFVASNIVKAKAKQIAPAMRWLQNDRVQATVNINNTCNAYSDGTTINFYRSNRRCQNTGRLMDVVYHEFGHSFHAHSIIRGVGSFDTALSEGASDYMAATITGDPAMGRGFFYSAQPLRHIDPPQPAVWPDAVGEAHQTGLIFGGAMWDLRKALVAMYGEQAGAERADALWYQVLRRASNIPSSYAEILAADDDDGDLANGTPHSCLINEAFATHGLADAALAGPPIGRPVLESRRVQLPILGEGSNCPGSSIARATLLWQEREDTAVSGEIALESDAVAWLGELPRGRSGSVLQYRVEIALENGQRILFPDNPADPWYELFVGEVVPIYCTDFETEEAPEGWRNALLAGNDQPGANDWQWGAPAGMPGSGDPGFAHSGQFVYGNDLGGENWDGKYQRNKQNIAWAPRVEIGDFPVIRLQYRRWLTIEDGDFDKGEILVNDQLAWANYATGGNGDRHHLDKEWRFHDVDITPFVRDGAVEVAFRMTSDRNLEFGGWTLDDFCIVGFTPPPEPVCGNGIVEEGEACDGGEGCAEDCTLLPVDPGAVCGNGVLEPGEACDGSEGCAPDCTLLPGAPDPMNPNGGGEGLEGEGAGCGCRESGGAAPSATALFGLGLGLLLLLLRRRRR